MKDDAEHVPCCLCGKNTDYVSTEICVECWELKWRMQKHPEIARKILEQLDNPKLLTRPFPFGTRIKYFDVEAIVENDQGGKTIRVKIDGYEQEWFWELEGIVCEVLPPE